MHCPRCKKELKPHQIGSTAYWDCVQCAVLWFDNKEIDFLTQEEAQKLNTRHSSSPLKKISYKCPRCGKKLYQEKYYLHCHNCGGILTNAEQLLKEKTNHVIQFAKKKHFNITQLKSVVIIAVILAFFLINYFIINSLGNKVSVTSQAANLHQTVRIQQVSSKQLAIFFTTDVPYKSTIYFKTKSTEWSQLINEKPNLRHFILIDKPIEATSFTIMLNDGEKETAVSETTSLPTQ